MAKLGRDRGKKLLQNVRENLTFPDGAIQSKGGQKKKKKRAGAPKRGKKKGNSRGGGRKKVLTGQQLTGGNQKVQLKGGRNFSTKNRPQFTQKHFGQYETK